MHLVAGQVDIETSEFVGRYVSTFNVLGLQVKTIDVRAVHPETTVNIHHPSWRPSARTELVVLAWVADEGHFHEECLVIPTLKVEEIGNVEGGLIQLSFQPGAVATRPSPPIAGSCASWAGSSKPL